MARKTTKQQLDEALVALTQAQNAYDLKLAEYNVQEEKAQTKRSIERGKIAEIALPELAALTKKQFEIYVEKVMQTDEARRILMELCAVSEKPAVPISGANTVQSGDNAAEKPAQAAPMFHTPPAPKPAGTPQSGGNGDNGQPNRHNTAQHAQKPTGTPHNGNGSGNSNGNDNTGQQA